MAQHAGDSQADRGAVVSLANQISRDAEFSAQFGDGSGLQELVGGSSGVRQGGRFRLFVQSAREA